MWLAFLALICLNIIICSSMPVSANSMISSFNGSIVFHCVNTLPFVYLVIMDPQLQLHSYCKQCRCHFNKQTSLRQFYFLLSLGISILFSKTTCTNLHAHQQRARISSSPHTNQHPLSFMFYIIDDLTAVRWYLKVVLSFHDDLWMLRIRLCNYCCAYILG